MAIGSSNDFTEPQRLDMTKFFKVQPPLRQRFGSIFSLFMGKELTDFDWVG